MDVGDREPNRPCSSPSTADRTIVDSGACLASTRASSITTATPEASSSAPGASPTESVLMVRRESRWPVTT